MDAFHLHAAPGERRALLANTIATVSPPPAAPPPFPSSPLTNLAYEDYQPGLGLLLVIALCGLVCLAACALCRLRRRRESGRCCECSHSLVCECSLLCTSHRRLSRWWTRGRTELSAVVGASEDAAGGPVPGGSLRSLAGPRGHHAAGLPLTYQSGEISGGPNLPSQRAQVAGALETAETAEMAELGSSSSDLERELDSDAAARVHSRTQLRQQLRALPPLGALEQREPHGRHVHAAELGALGALGALGGAPGPGGGEPPELSPRAEAGAVGPLHQRLPEAREVIPREQALRTAIASDELRGGGPTPEELLPVEPPWHAGRRAGRSEEGLACGRRTRVL